MDLASDDGMVQTSIFQVTRIVKTVYLNQIVKLGSLEVN